MKSKLLLTACMLMAGNLVKAQQSDFPGYGKPTSEELAMKECSFDRNANAVILIHEAYSDYDNQGQLLTYHHIRMKILKEKGIGYSNIKIPYYRDDNFEKIKYVEGFTINPDPGGTVVKTKLDKQSIYDQKTTNLRGEVNFAFPSVKVGSILEYRYESIMKSYGGLEEWDFQEVLPVMVSRYRLVILPNTEFAYRVSKRNDMPVDIQPDNEKGQISFEMQNIPGLDWEPYMDARNDYLQKVIFQLSGTVTNRSGTLGLMPGTSETESYMNSWKDVIHKLVFNHDFGDELKKNIPGTGELARQVENLAPEAKMRVVHHYVRNNLNWNNIYSKYATEGLKSVWQKRQGTSGEINLLLVNLLRSVDLEADPVLVSERFHGKVDPAYPFLDQFNTVFASVLINNKRYFLDATDKFTPSHLTPYNILNTTALLVSRKNGGIINISNESMKYEDEIETKLTVSGSGEISGTVQVKSRDYARVKRLTDLRENRESYLRSYFEKDKSQVTFGEFEILNETTDSLALEQRGTFVCKQMDDGNYEYIPLDLFSGFRENPFLADERFSNINFGYRKTVSIHTYITYPANYVVDAIPKAMKLTNRSDDIVITRQVNHDIENKIVYSTIILDFKNGLYPVHEYARLQELYKQMFNLLKEPVLLKKK